MAPLVREQGSFSVEVTLRWDTEGETKAVMVYREQDYRQREE